MVEQKFHRIEQERSERRIPVITVAPDAATRPRLIDVIVASEALDLVGAATDGRDAMRLCPRVQPDVVVVDARSAGVDGPDLCRRIYGQWPWIQVLVVTDEPERDDASREEGAGGICFMPGRPLNGSVGATVRSLVERRTESPAWDGAGPGLRAYPDRALSPREYVVWRALQEGLTDTQIAERLAVNELTARFHVENVLEKQGLEGRRDLLAPNAAAR